MDFQDIEDIKEYFGITTDNLEEIRKELKLQLSKIHPDKTEGTFKSKKQKKEYEELGDAIKFLDSVNDQIVFSKKEFDVIEQKIDSLILARLHKPLAQESECLERLDTSITSSILTFKKQHYFVKISSTILAGLLTLLWTFPTIIEKNKFLKHLIDFDNLIFTCIWLGVILLTCAVWIFTKNNERKDELIKKRYSLVSTQNAIFKIFIGWINAANIKSKEYDNKNHIHITYFTKEELMSFIFNFSEEYLQEFELSIGLSQLELGNEVDKKYKDELKLKNLKPRKESVGLFFKKPGEIDIDLSQKLADAIVEKLLNKKMIFVTDLKSFSETYRFDYKYM